MITTTQVPNFLVHEPFGLNLNAKLPMFQAAPREIAAMWGGVVGDAPWPTTINITTTILITTTITKIDITIIYATIIITRTIITTLYGFGQFYDEGLGLRWFQVWKIWFRMLA